MTRSRAPRSRRRFSSRLDEAEPIPAYERAEQIYLVGGVNLRAEFGGETRLLLRVREERCLVEWSLRAGVEVSDGAWAVRAADAAKLGRRSDDVVGIAGLQLGDAARWQP